LAPWWAWCAVGVLLAIGAGVLAYETRGTTFWADEWNWILTRRGGGISTLLDPHNSHLSLVPVVIYKILFAIVGLRHYWPYRAVLIAADLGCALLVFVYARRRVGGYLALLVTAMILFFGPSWQDILWPFQVAWLISIGSGVAALLALDRKDRLGEVIACVLLTVSLASSGAGLAVWIGGLVEIGQRRRWRELWIVAIPIVLYGLWWLGYEQSHIFGHSFLLLPKFVFTAAAGALSALAGLANVDIAHDTGTYLTWGTPLLVLAVLALAWRARRPGGLPARAVTLLAVAIGFWILAGVGRAYTHVGPLVLTETGDESRYLYIGAVAIALLVVELARGYVPSAWGYAVATVVAAVSVVSNITPLRDGAGFLRAQAQITRTLLGTFDMTRPIVSPNFVSHGFVFELVTAPAWFAAERDLGSVAYTPGQIAALGEYPRQAADSQLIAIQGLAVKPTGPSGLGSAPAVDAAESGSTSTAANCVTFRPVAFTSPGINPALDLTMPAAGLEIRAGAAPAAIGARRFADQFSALGTLAPDSSGVLDVKPDLAPQPWHVQVASNAPFSVCGI
jgi:hypothetical protein